MKARGDRPIRVAERIREEISLILQHKVKDPGLVRVTVTDVTMTGDLKAARIHYSVLGGEEERLVARDALRRSRGYVRKALGGTLKMRYIPDITFHYDNSFEKGERIDTLLRKAAEGPLREE